MTNEEALNFIEKHCTPNVMPVDVKIKCVQALLLAIEAEKNHQEDAPASSKYSDDNRCVCCGEIIPEGRQVCVQCERKIF